jgi:tripartite-type tricarboxylate transporter receptor subunit TctC
MAQAQPVLCFERAHRRLLFRASLLGCASLALLGSAHAQSNYPYKPLRIIVPFPPGSSTDVAARALSPGLSGALGQSIVIDNRSGASGQIGVELSARAAPDGYTMGVGTTSTHVLAPQLNRSLGYDVQRDFSPVSLIGSLPYALTLHSGVPASSVRELIELARSKPGSIRYASAGNASLAHLAGELFAGLSKTRLTHVPYKSSALSVIDVLAGRIDMQFGTIPPVLPHVRGGKLKAIAVTGARRLASMPQVPTVQESGIAGYEVSLWMGVFLPAGVPAAISETLHRALVGAITLRSTVETLSASGIDAESSSTERFIRFIGVERQKYAKVIKDAGIRND